MLGGFENLAPCNPKEADGFKALSDQTGPVEDPGKTQYGELGKATEQPPRPRLDVQSEMSAIADMRDRHPGF